jgi:hypothetical protein
MSHCWDLDLDILIILPKVDIDILMEHIEGSIAQSLYELIVISIMDFDIFLLIKSWNDDYCSFRDLDDNKLSFRADN